MISEMVFSGCCNRTSIIASSSWGCIALKEYGLPITALSALPILWNFCQNREIVLLDICNSTLTSSIWKPIISVNQIALQRKS